MGAALHEDHVARARVGRAVGAADDLVAEGAERAADLPAAGGRPRRLGEVDGGEGHG